MKAEEFDKYCKAIEERAKDLFPDAFDADEIIPAREGYIVERQRSAYRLGATEQKAINDAELQSYVDMTAKEVKQVMIDKACEWLNSQLYTDDGGCLASEWYQQLDNFLEAFRQAMEDGI